MDNPKIKVAMYTPFFFPVFGGTEIARAVDFSLAARF